MFKAHLILLFLVGIAPVLEVSAAFCTKYGPDAKVIRICCPGYEGDGVNCVPFCRCGCINGVCVKPDFCECHEGFAKHNGPHSPCEPIATALREPQPHSCLERCANGTCVDDTCTCAQGWLLQQHEGREICVPQCNGGCVNGYCSATNNCVCYEGFEAQASNQRECVRRSSSGALSTQLAQMNGILVSLLLISCYYAYWRTINTHTEHHSKCDLKRSIKGKR
ncbi:PREDICTED: multiple epidermal growth factor-like domains protein 11 [Bactrocera latifrons]|uniref:multiple epidermal growth factor-like domains protein 11 n=1 Tax=Bactrocera latifrons TaxID=174628 RepID=UPI0008DCA6EE|nr:PREDICTED: multiple epidermal growth factor-like domains protein 11 [Bactrocera latifrons]